MSDGIFQSVSQYTDVFAHTHFSLQMSQAIRKKLANKKENAFVFLPH